MREKLAAVCHSQWSGWIDYMFSKGVRHSNGTLTLPKWAVDRWTRQMETPYSELSENEKASDRIEADKFLEITGGMMAQEAKGSTDVGWMSAKAVLEYRIARLRSKADALEQLLNELPDELSNEADEALWGLVVNVHHGL